VRLLSLRRVAGVLLLATGCSGGQPGAPSAGPSVSVPPGTLARSDHVVVVIEENKGYADVIGNATAPYLNGLAAQGALFDHSFAVAHPSQPNYDGAAGNHIATIVVGAGVRPGVRSEPITHYTVLRTLEEMFGLPALGSAASTGPITDLLS
jgi:acid phosphatase